MDAPNDDPTDLYRLALDLAEVQRIPVSPRKPDLHSFEVATHDGGKVYVVFLGRLLDLEFSAGAESLEVALLGEEEIPWAELAFPSIEKTLRLFFEDRRTGTFGTHVADIHRRPR